MSDSSLVGDSSVGDQMVSDGVWYITFGLMSDSILGSDRFW